MINNVFAFVVVLGILIFFHELGHFLVARLFGVGVEKFSLGFGPKIIGKKFGMTDYRISAIPLGGYVKMVGEEPDAELSPEDIPYSFTHKHVLKKMLIVAAGPFFNLLLAVIIFFFIFQFNGNVILKATVGGVEEGTPAFESGVQAGDEIVGINGSPVKSWDEMAVLITESNGNVLVFDVMRGNEVIALEITPLKKAAKNLFGEDIDRYVIGVTSAGEIYTEALNPFQAVSQSIAQTYNITKLTIVSIVKLIQGRISAKTLGGPIMIAEMAGQQAEAGSLNFVFFISLLSINLAILNFLPIPVLDGGHLMFFFIELIIRRPINTRVREIAQQTGMVILLTLMIFVFYNDITRVFFE
ncbi:MAG: RIP metalloprotease RseP [Desulfobacterales bacterium]|nr:RIP metalloprotease RseP [Desulfobacterales bacterium]